MHPYIGLPATTSTADGGWSGVIVHVGTASQELCAGVVEHNAVAVLLLADGTHKKFDVDRLIVDPAEAAARLAKHS